jgi:SNF2 family DNA or RNA helicase
VEASYAIYYSKGFKLEHDLQSEARNHRGGSEMHDKVTRIDIVAKGTIDELITESLEKKQNIAERILSWKDRLLE